MSHKSENKIAARAIAASLVVAGTLAGASQGMAMENWGNGPNLQNWGKVPNLNGLHQHPTLMAQHNAEHLQNQVRIAYRAEEDRNFYVEQNAIQETLNNAYDQEMTEKQTYHNFLCLALRGKTITETKKYAQVLTQAKNVVPNPMLAHLITQSVGQPMDQRIQAITNYMNQNGL